MHTGPTVELHSNLHMHTCVHTPYEHTCRHTAPLYSCTHSPALIFAYLSNAVLRKSSVHDVGNVRGRDCESGIPVPATRRDVQHRPGDDSCWPHAHRPAFQQQRSGMVHGANRFCCAVRPADQVAVAFSTLLAYKCNPKRKKRKGASCSKYAASRS